MLKQFEKDCKEIRKLLKMLENLPPDKVYIGGWNVYKYIGVHGYEISDEGGATLYITVVSVDNGEIDYRPIDKNTKFVTKEEALEIVRKGAIEREKDNIKQCEKRLKEHQQRLKELENVRSCKETSRTV